MWAGHGGVIPAPLEQDGRSAASAAAEARRPASLERTAQQKQERPCYENPQGEREKPAPLTTTCVLWHVPAYTLEHTYTHVFLKTEEIAQLVKYLLKSVRA